ncbi:MAG: diphthamide biosynthesis enzyme Dph2 [Methanobacteriota archaeon]|nr:MAG: diphthamide biosynthesis enzyme Dph2 [Euryarchaeota archaeon]
MESGNMRILLQFPEGLKRYALDYAAKLEADGNEVFISASPCYGACDLCLDEARHIRADKIIHYGHYPFIKKVLDIEVEYVPFYIDISPAVIEKLLSFVKDKGFRSISLNATVQHMHQFKDIVKRLEELQVKVVYKEGHLAAEPGHLLGCEDGSHFQEGVDAIITIADGLFHATAISKVPSVPVYVFNPYDGKATLINDIIKKRLRKRRAALAAAIEAETIAILVSTKPGQFSLSFALNTKKKLASFGKKTVLLVANELSPESVGNFQGIDVFINTACPRLADDHDRFGKPVLGMDLVGELFEQLSAMAPK